MENYFNYFTEIEEHFQKKRGLARWLSPIDWALIESFQEAGIPLETVLSGIDEAFEKHGKRKRRAGKINSLAYCTQAILVEFERQKGNLVGTHAPAKAPAEHDSKDRENLLQLLDKACAQLEQSVQRFSAAAVQLPPGLLESVVHSLQAIKSETAAAPQIDYETLNLKLSVLEEKLLGAVTSCLDEALLMSMRIEVNSELARHKQGLKAEQLALMEKKLLNKKLVEHFGLPRLNLFYLPLN